MIQRAQQVLPGLLIAAVLALASAFVSEHYGGPTLLYALLLGMALNHLSEVPRYQPGIGFAGRQVLRIGVALLGARITLDQILALGPRPLVIVVIGVPFTLLLGIGLARLLGQKKRFGALTGGAVAICGASAAMAVAAVLPRHKDSDRHLIFAVVGVTTLSTVAMILYPVITSALELDGVSAGIFLGGTIHDVAQVVGAGYLLGEEAGDTATFTKLLRVAMLVPVVIAISLIVARRRESGAEDQRPPILPLFLLAFLVIVAINSTGWIPQQVTDLAVSASRWCLITAIAAVGMKASLKDMATLGWQPLVLIVGETLALALLVLGILLLWA